MVKINANFRRCNADGHVPDDDKFSKIGAILSEKLVGDQANILQEKLLWLCTMCFNV